MDQRRSCFIILLWICIVAALGKGTPANAGKKNDTCYKPCRVKSGPVCGTDGRNYSTGCHLSVARCRARKIGQKIALLKTGFCGSSKPLSPCFLNCTSRRQPVCGSDKVTYKNLCLFKMAKCQKRKKKQGDITIISRKGPCGKFKPAKAKPCRKFNTCPKVNRPVCGTDNKDYKNICHLKTTNCVLKRKARGKKVQKLTLKHCGVCGRIKQCSSSWQPKCPPIKLCDQMLNARGGTRVGTRRKTKKGNGRTKRSPIRKGKKTKVKTSKSNGKKKPNLKGKRKFAVCGTDGKTYKSVCHLQVEQCNKMKKCQRLYMRSKGPCKRRSHGR